MRSKDGKTGTKSPVVRLSAKDRERRTIATTIDTDIEDRLEGELPDVLRTISEWISEHKDYDTVHIDSEYFGDYTSWRLIGSRLENDEEYNSRLDKLRAKKRKAIFEQEAAERKLFKELLKKYGEPDTRNKPSKEELGLT